MELTIVIPSHNDTELLVSLLGDVEHLQCAEKVVVVDDGSESPIEAEAISELSGFPATHLEVLRQPVARGAGAARNLGLTRVHTDHMLFLDADDRLTQELPHLMEDLSGQHLDFCLFQYHDTRMAQEAVWGQMPWDQTLWEQAGLALGAMSEVPEAAMPFLARTANYPWNKLYRTEFLRQNGIGCTEIMVHEDMELHWRSFLEARDVYASDRICVIHKVSEQGERLTNRKGAERLKAIPVLAELAALTQTRRDGRLAAAFERFGLGLLDWISAQLDPEIKPSFAQLSAELIGQHFSEAGLRDLSQDDPYVFRRIQALIGEKATA